MTHPSVAPFHTSSQRVDEHIPAVPKEWLLVPSSGHNSSPFVPQDPAPTVPASSLAGRPGQPILGYHSGEVKHKQHKLGLPGVQSGPTRPKPEKGMDSNDVLFAVFAAGAGLTSHKLKTGVNQ